jgi:hypothetical protein
MGLDMYLKADRHLSKYDEEDTDIATTIGALTVKNPTYRVTSVSVMVMQWRKANAIHNWFVKNVQFGNDNCATYNVCIDDLEQFYKICCRVLQNETLAQELLPPVEGFFFGSQNIDPAYLADLEETVEIVGDFLQRDDLNKWDFTYRSSW